MDDHLSDYQKEKVYDESLEGNRRYLHKSAVAFTFTIGKKPRVGSGTLVDCGGRLLVATAGHNLLKNPHGRYSFVGMSETDQKDGVLEILNFGKADGEWPDVGFFELDRGKAISYLAKEPSSMDQIAVTSALDAERIAYVIGYPSDDVDIRKTPEVNYVTLQATCYTHPPLEIHSWPTTPFDSQPADPAVDIFVRWNKGEALRPFENTRREVLGEPYGMSGGGVWQSTHQESELWSPTGLRLVGIQSRWHAPGKYIRAVQIVHWLRLIHSALPELRKTIEGCFESVDFQ